MRSERSQSRAEIVERHIPDNLGLAARSGRTLFGQTALSPISDKGERRQISNKGWEIYSTVNFAAPPRRST